MIDSTMLLSLGIVSAVVSLLVSFIKSRSWSWTTVQLMVLVLSFVGAGAYYYSVEAGWNWEEIMQATAAILVSANGLYTMLIKPFLPEFSKGR